MSLFGPKVAVAIAQGGGTHHHTHIEMVDPSVEKGAKYLDEVQEKAHQRIVHAMLVEVPGIGITVMRYEVERVLSSMDSRHRVAFAINGQEFDIGLEVGDWERPERIVEIVVDKIARSVLERALRQQPRLVDHMGLGGKRIR